MFVLILSFVVCSALAAYWYFWHHLQYWKKRGIPGPDAELFYGNWKKLDKYEAPRALVLQKYGSYYGIYEGITKTLVVSDVEMLQDLFVRKFENFYSRKLNPLAPDPDTDPRVHVFGARGLRWKRLRTLTTPSFSVNSLKKMRPTVEDSAKVAISLMRKYADSGESFDIYKHYQEYTLDIISRVAMGQKGTRQFNNDYIKLVSYVFTRRIDNMSTYLATGVPALVPLIRKLFTLTAPLHGNLIPPLLARIRAAVEERKSERAARGAEQPEPEDFIDLLLDAEAEVDVEEHAGFSRQSIKVDKKLTTEEIVAQCFVFLLAGFDTTANSLAYATHLLATHAEVQRRAREEIDAVCGSDEDIGHESLNELTYLEAIAKETLRLYPLASNVSSRMCTKATTLGDVVIEEGVCVSADVFTVQRSKEIWGEDAEEFVPERWLDNRPKHQLAWLPFGAGPRICIGMRLALMEEKMLLAYILRNFEIVPSADVCQFRLAYRNFSFRLNLWAQRQRRLHPSLYI